MGPRARPRQSSNDIHFEFDELLRNFGEALGSPLRPAILDRDGAAFNPAEFAQPLHESGGPLARRCRRACAQEPDDRRLPHLLRGRDEWPCRYCRREA